MKPSMAKPSHFHWTTNKVTNNDDNNNNNDNEQQKHSSAPTEVTNNNPPKPDNKPSSNRRKLQSIAVSRFRSVVMAFTNRRLNSPARVTGTLFGRRRGHVSFALQKDPSSDPSFLVQLATPISFLVREMASGLVRIALECDRTTGNRQLAEEVTWRAYCNGKRCGFASKRGYGERERRVLKAVEMVSMGAGVLPGGEKKVGKGEEREGEEEGEEEDEGEVMYMRARFERVVGDKDSEAFYMMNPDSNGAPELSIYLLRV